MKPWLSRISFSVITLVIIAQIVSAQNIQEPKAQRTISTSINIGASYINLEGFVPSFAINVSPTVQVQTSLWNIRGTGHISIFDSKTLSGFGELFVRRIIDQNSRRIITVDAEGGIGTYRGQALGRYLSSSLHLGTRRNRGRLYIGQAQEISSYTVLGAEFQHSLVFLSNTDITASLSSKKKGYMMYNLAIKNTYQFRDIQLLGHVGVSNDPSLLTFRPLYLWGIASAEIPLQKRLALSISAGHSGIDVERGIRRTYFISLGAKLGGKNTFNKSENQSSKTFIRNDLNVQTLVIRLTEKAKVVEVRGDFTSWRPVAMQLSPEGEWKLPLSLKSGVYAITIRIDGENWKTPPGIQTAIDEFGGSNGILIIP